MFGIHTRTGGRGAVEIERIVEHRDTILRIGLVHDERLISDRAFEGQTKITIGRDKRCDIVLDEDYSGPVVRFSDLCPDSVTLHAPATMRIRLAQGDRAPADIEQLARRGLAVVKGEKVTVHVPLASRGRVVMGPYTLLFQVIRRRVRVPLLPGQGVARRLAGALVDDPAWAACLAMSVFLVGALAAQAVAFEHKTGRYIRDSLPPEAIERQSMFIEVATPDLKEQDPPPIAPGPVPAAKVKKPEATEAKTPKSPKKRANSDKGKKPDDVDSAAKSELLDGPRNAREVKAAVRRRTIAGAFGSTSKLWQRASDGEGDVIAQTAFGSEKATGSEGGGEGPAAVVRGDASRGGELVLVTTGKRGFGGRKRGVTQVSPDKAERKVAKIALTFTLDGPKGGGQAQVARVLRRKNSAIRRCYEAALRQNPSLGGKVKVVFTVGTAGTITAVRVIGATGEFHDCIVRKLKQARGLPMLDTPTSFTQSYVFSQQ